MMAETDIVKFAKDVLGIELQPYQEELLRRVEKGERLVLVSRRESKTKLAEKIDEILNEYRRRFKQDVWSGLWTREVSPEEREEWLYEVKAAGDALKERCQYHKEQSKKRGKQISTLRKSRDAFIESLVKAEERIKELEEELKDADRVRLDV